MKVIKVRLGTFKLLEEKRPPGYVFRTGPDIDSAEVRGQGSMGSTGGR